MYLNLFSIYQFNKILYEINSKFQYTYDILMILEESSDVSIFRIITIILYDNYIFIFDIIAIRFTAQSKEAENRHFHRSFAILEICRRYYDEKLSIRDWKCGMHYYVKQVSRFHRSHRLLSFIYPRSRSSFCYTMIGQTVQK